MLVLNDSNETSRKRKLETSEGVLPKRGRTALTTQQRQLYGLLDQKTLCSELICSLLGSIKTSMPKDAYVQFVNKSINYNGYTRIIHRAVKSPDVLRYLCAQGDVDLNVQNRGKSTVMHIAAKDGRCETLKIIVAHGADTNKKDSNGFTPLKHAVERNRGATVAYLLAQNVSLDGLDDSYMAALKAREGRRALSLSLILRVEKAIVEHKCGELEKRLQHSKQEHGEQISALQLTFDEKCSELARSKQEHGEDISKLQCQVRELTGQRDEKAAELANLQEKSCLEIGKLSRDNAEASARIFQLESSIANAARKAAQQAAEIQQHAAEIARLVNKYEIDCPTISSHADRLELYLEQKFMQTTRSFKEFYGEQLGYNHIDSGATARISRIVKSGQTLEDFVVGYACNCRRSEQCRESCEIMKPLNRLVVRYKSILDKFSEGGSLREGARDRDNATKEIFLLAKPLYEYLQRHCALQKKQADVFQRLKKDVASVENQFTVLNNPENNENLLLRYQKYQRMVRSVGAKIEKESCHGDLQSTSDLLDEFKSKEGKKRSLQNDLNDLKSLNARLINTEVECVQKEANITMLKLKGSISTDEIFRRIHPSIWQNRSEALRAKEEIADKIACIKQTFFEPLTQNEFPEFMDQANERLTELELCPIFILSRSFSQYYEHQELLSSTENTVVRKCLVKCNGDVVVVKETVRTERDIVNEINVTLKFKTSTNRYSNIMIPTAVFKEESNSETKYFIEMPYAHGNSLNVWLLQGHSINNRIHVLQEICKGVQDLHDKGVIHCAVELENVLMSSPDGDAFPIICDFGLVQDQGAGSSSATDSGRPLYSQPYRAPELSRVGGQGGSKKTDCYALGKLARKLLLDIDAASAIDNYGPRGTLSEERFNACKEFCRNLLKADENKRMSVSDALKHHLFAAATATNNLNYDRMWQRMVRHARSISRGGSPAIEVRPGADLVADMITVFKNRRYLGQCKGPIGGNAFLKYRGMSGYGQGVHYDVLTNFFERFARENDMFDSNESKTMFLPKGCKCRFNRVYPDECGCDFDVENYRALGRIITRAVLDKVDIKPLFLAPSVFLSLLEREDEIGLQDFQAYDPDLAEKVTRRVRGVKDEDLNREEPVWNGNAEIPLCSSNKELYIKEYCREQLLYNRKKSLDALCAPFIALRKTGCFVTSLDDVLKESPFKTFPIGEFKTLVTGVMGVEPSSIVAKINFKDKSNNGENFEIFKAWIKSYVEDCSNEQRLSFLRAMTGRNTIPSNMMTISLESSQERSQRKFRIQSCFSTLKFYNFSPGDYGEDMGSFVESFRASIEGNLNTMED